MEGITNQEMKNLSGGASQIECFFMGAIFAAAISTGNVLAAAGSGVYLASNCLN
jgi:hypothetical protein